MTSVGDTDVDDAVRRALERPLPKRHALDFYKVLGTLVGCYMNLGYSNEDAERRAEQTIAGCKPKRGRSR